MKTFVALWCEWDFGQEGIVFECESDAEKWLWEQMPVVDGGCVNYFGWTKSSDIFDEGGAGFRLVTLYEKTSDASA